MFHFFLILTAIPLTEEPELSLFETVYKKYLFIAF